MKRSYTNKTINHFMTAFKRKNIKNLITLLVCERNLCTKHSFLHQRFSTGGTRTPKGTPAVAKGYAGKNIVKQYFFAKTDNTNAFLLLPTLLLSYSVFFTK